MRDRFDSEYIEAELERIGKGLEPSFPVFLIGGGSMTFRELKDTTKDIDLVVTSETNLAHLQTSLQERGYNIVRHPTNEYDALGAHRILENGDGCRIDIFNQQVVDKLVLSGGMKERSEKLINVGGFSVNLVSAEDIFLFKAVAGRTDDIDDLFVLYQTALDFDVIEAELRHQIALLEQELFVTHVNEALIELTERHNITTPMTDTVAEMTAHIYQELEVLNEIDEPSTISNLHEALDLTPSEIETTIRNLEQKNVIAVDGNRVIKTSSPL